MAEYRIWSLSAGGPIIDITFLINLRKKPLETDPSHHAMNRKPAVAGSFYPADSLELQAMLHDMLDKVDAPATAPKAMIVPHAGYIYSGDIAATAYARLAQVKNSIKRVILLGPTHRVAVKGMATVSTDTFTTPLGDIAIDQETIAAIGDMPQVIVSDKAHALEHSLEVHLPFLQTCLDTFTLIPFAVGECPPADVAAVLQRLWGSDETLIVISSDLSHYLDYDTARQRDKTTSDNIVALRYEHIGYDDACGRNPIRGLLHLAREKGYGVEMIDLRNSGDTAGSRDRVVGYGSYVLTQPSDSRYTWADGQQLIETARQSIVHGLQAGKPASINVSDYDSHLVQTRACFVTLKLQGQLRGCIGSLEARRPLLEDVAENAFSAAFRDPRFKPLTSPEFANLDIHISILTPAVEMSFTSESDLLSQLTPGEDGLILEDRGKRGTFLPAVWESLPTPEQFWGELKRKAGLPYEHWSDTLKVYRYETQMFP